MKIDYLLLVVAAKGKVGAKTKLAVEPQFLSLRVRHFEGWRERRRHQRLYDLSEFFTGVLRPGLLGLRLEREP